MYKAFRCRECGADLEVPADTGRWFRCPHCMRNTTVPEDATPVDGALSAADASGHEKDAAGPVEVRGKRLVCPVCGGNRFWARRTLMNTALATFFDAEYLDKTARNQICAECGYIFWFFED